MKKQVLSIVLFLIISICALPLSVNADIESPSNVVYNGGALDDYYSIYTVKSNVIIEKDTILQSQNTLIIENDAVLTIKKGVTVQINGTLQINNGGKLIIQNKSNIVFDIDPKYKYIKIDGMLQGYKGSSIIIKQGNIIVGDNGKIHYNGVFNESDDVSDYILTVAGKLTKGKDGTRTVKAIKQSAKNIIMTEFPHMPVIYANAKSLRFTEQSRLNNINVKQLDNLKKLKNLETLELYDGIIENLSFLKDLSKLKTLDLGYMWVNDLSALIDLKSLKTLRLQADALNGEKFEILKKMTNLEVIDFSRVVYGISGCEESIKELQEALPNTKIIYGKDVYTDIYDSFYAKVISDKNYGTRVFQLCDEDGNVLSDVQFKVYGVNYWLSGCEVMEMTAYFDKKGKSTYSFTYFTGDVVKIYYDYRDTTDGLRVEEYAEKGTDNEIRIYAYRVDKIISELKF